MVNPKTGFLTKMRIEIVHLLGVTHTHTHARARTHTYTHARIHACTVLIEFHSFYQVLTSDEESFNYNIWCKHTKHCFFDNKTLMLQQRGQKSLLWQLRRNTPKVRNTLARNISLAHLGLHARKSVFGNLRTTKGRPACASAQTGQRLCYSLFGKCHT